MLSCSQLQLPFPGTLYITAQHTCFSSCTRDGQEIVVKVQHGQVKASNKIQPKKRGNAVLQSLYWILLAVILCVCCSMQSRHAQHLTCTSCHCGLPLCRLPEGDLVQILTSVQGTSVYLQCAHQLPGDLTAITDNIAELISVSSQNV